MIHDVHKHDWTAFPNARAKTSSRPLTTCFALILSENLLYIYLKTLALHNCFRFYRLRSNEAKASEIDTAQVCSKKGERCYGYKKLS